MGKGTREHKYNAPWVYAPDPKKENYYKQAEHLLHENARLLANRPNADAQVFVEPTDHGFEARFPLDERTKHVRLRTCVKDPTETDYEPYSVHRYPTFQEYFHSSIKNSLKCAAAMCSSLSTKAVYILLQICLALMCLLSVTSLVDVSVPAHVSAHCYFAATPQSLSSLWCCDSGTNRFVTNDIADFVPGSIRHVNTPVAVGSGTISSTLMGSCVIKSHEGNLLKATNVLYLPSCSRKLLPPSPFIRKGCQLRLWKTNVVQLLDPSGKCLLEGKEQDGIYYFNAVSISNKLHTNLNDTNTDSAATAHFGLAAGKTPINTSDPEFPRRLLEAHWAYGHLHFDKLRKLLGLKPGNNPDCPTCTLAKSRKEKLQPFYRQRSTIDPITGSILMLVSPVVVCHSKSLSTTTRASPTLM